MTGVEACGDGLSSLYNDSGSLHRFPGGIVISHRFAELSEERLAVGSAGPSRHEDFFQSLPVLMTVLTMTRFTEVLEVFAVAVPPVAVFIVFTGFLSGDCLAAGNTGHLPIGSIPPQRECNHC